MKLEELTEYKRENTFIEQLIKFANAVSTRPCDKCRQSVPTSNSALVFQFINSLGIDWTLAMAQNRHLEPVTDSGGRVICEGSPSRWKLVSELSDSRPQYASKPSEEDKCIANEIWQIMQALSNKELK